MNVRMVFRILGKVLLLEAGFLLVPFFVGLGYGENCFATYLIPIAACAAVGAAIGWLPVKDKSIYAREGFVTVAFTWILISLFGALPFSIAHAVPTFADAIFETASGFTTTGASVIANVEGLPHSLLMWRALTHWMGGMGVLVLVLAFLPGHNAGVIHVFRAESPGPSVGKIMSKLTYTARILYGIYIGLTVLETIFLIAGRMPVFDSVTHALATAGTGGFGIKNTSIGYYDSVYFEMVIAVFMFLFGINFNVYFFLLVGQVGKAFLSEEFLAYVSIVVIATVCIALNLLSVYDNFAQALRYAFFQVTSISSTTGFATANFDAWPAFSKAILVFLMIMGASAGSTGGGIKVSRFLILGKSAAANVRRMIHPRSVVAVRFEGEALGQDVIRNVLTYFVLWIVILGIGTLVLCLDVDDFLTNFTAMLSCLGNIGPGLNRVGPMENFALYAPWTKVFLSFIMLAGRLEIFPIIVLFAPRTWKRV